MLLPSMANCSVSAVRGVYENLDGIMIISAPGKHRGDRPQVAMARLLYADSNRYLLPTDKVTQIAREVADEQAEFCRELNARWRKQYQRGVQAHI